MLFANSIRLAAFAKLPFILCSSLPLRETLNQNASSLPTRVDPGYHVRKLQGNTLSCLPRLALRDITARQRQMRKNGFNEVVTWCAAHQEIRKKKCNEKPGEDALTEERQRMAEWDTAAVHWIQEATQFFTCGQGLVVISLLCDVLTHSAASLPPSSSHVLNSRAATTSSDESVSDGDARPRLFFSLCSTIAALLQQVTAHEQLDAQPLVALMSAIYGLYRVSRLPVVATDSSSMELLKTPHALLFAMLHHVKADASFEKIVAEDEALALETLLTFLLVMDEQRKKELLGQGDQSVMRTVLRRFMMLVSPSLKLFANGSGVSGTAGECGSAADVMDDGTDSMACTPVMNSGTVTFAECDSILQNLQPLRSPVQLSVAEYLLCVVNHPQRYSEEDIAVLPGIFRTLDTLPHQEKKQRLFSYVIGHLGHFPTGRLDFDSQLLPYMTAQQQQAALLTYNHQSYECLTAVDAARVLMLPGAAQLSWESQRLLVWISCRPHALFFPPGQSHPSDVQGYNSQSMNDSNTGETLPDRVSMAPALLAALQFLLLVKIPCLNEVEDREERAEALQMAESIATRVDWSKWDNARSATTEPSGESGHTLPADTLDSRMAFKVLNMYVRCIRVHGFTSIVKVEDKILLNLYVRRTLQLESQLPLIEVLHLLRELGELLEHRESLKQLSERLIRFNGTQTAASAYRFAMFIAPMAVSSGAKSSDMVKLLLKQRSLDARGVHAFSRYTTSTSRSQILTQVLANALNFLLMSDEWPRRELESEIRHCATQWLDSYFHFLSHASHVSASYSGDAASSPKVDAFKKQNVDVVSASADSHSVVENELVVVDTAEIADVADDELEKVCSLALLMGCHPLTHCVTVLKQRLRCTHSLPADEGAGVEERADAVLKGYVGNDGVFDGVASSAFTPQLEALPLPAHFVLLVRSDTDLPLPLSSEYLERLLTTCSIPLYNLVANAYFTLLKRCRRQANVLSDIQLVHLILRTFVQRVSQLDESAVSLAFTFTTPSTVALNITRCILVYLGHQVRYTKVFNALGRRGHVSSERGVAECGTASVSGSALDDGQNAESVVSAKSEEKDAAYLLLGEGILEPDGGAVPGCTSSLGIGQLVEERNNADRYFIQTLSYLVPDHVRDVSLSLLDHLHVFFPGASVFVFARLSRGFDLFTPTELLTLARKYPPAEHRVLEHLKTVDIRLTLEFSTFLRVAQALPMSINVAVIEAHAPGLEFAVCTRLLSTLSTHEEVFPFNSLATVVSRALERADGVTDSDKYILLTVLQGYTEVNESEGGGKGRLASSLPASVLQKRRNLLSYCCDKLLSLESIKDPDSLRAVLNVYPVILRGMVERVLVDQAERNIISPSLDAKVKDLDTILSVTQLLQQHGMLLLSTTTLLRDRFFRTSSATQFCTGEHSLSKYSLQDCVRLALLLKDGRSKGSTSMSMDSALAAGSDASHSALCDCIEALTLLREAYTSTTDHLALFAILGELNMSTSATRDPRPTHLTASHHFSIFLDRLCEELIESSSNMSASDFARFVQQVSRLKRWHLVRSRLGADDTASFKEVLKVFDDALRTSYAGGEAHSRSVILRALSDDVELFHHYEGFLIPPIQVEIGVLSADEVECVLTAMLRMQCQEHVEVLLDAAGTRLLSMLHECKQSTLIRLLQCHAHFNIVDDALIDAVLAALDEQTTRELKLNTLQILMLLDAVVKLDVLIPDRLAIWCFSRLEKNLDTMSLNQLTQVGQFAVDVEMGYSSVINNIVTRIFENREGLRGTKRFMEVVELLCDTYDVEAPPQLRESRLRKRRKQYRLQDYMRRQQVLLEGLGK